MKLCPKCGKKWPDTGKFCPMDGTPLVAEQDEEDSSAKPTRILSADELPTLVGDSEPPSKPAAVEPPKPSAPRVEPISPKEKPSVPKVEPVTPSERPPAPKVEPLSPTTSEAKAPKQVAPEPEPAPVEPEEQVVVTEDRPGTFSETKWFMIGEHIKDEEIEASDLPIEDLQEIYKRTESLPEEVRKKYSLRYKGKKGGADSQKKGKD